jgi:hypothetical protein
MADEPIGAEVGEIAAHADEIRWQAAQRLLPQLPVGAAVRRCAAVHEDEGSAFAAHYLPQADGQEPAARAKLEEGRPRVVRGRSSRMPCHQPQQVADDARILQSVFDALFVMPGEWCRLDVFDQLLRNDDLHRDLADIQCGTSGFERREKACRWRLVQRLGRRLLDLAGGWAGDVRVLYEPWLLMLLTSADV